MQQGKISLPAVMWMCMLAYMLMCVVETLQNCLDFYSYYGIFT